MNVLYLDLNNLSKINASPNDILVFSNGEKLSPEHEQNLKQEFQRNEQTVFLLDSFPFKDGGYIDPVTLETDYAENDRFAISLDMFLTVGGHDKRLRAAAVTDIVWRIGALGGRAVYLPNVCVSALQKSAGDKSSRFIGALMLALKYADKKTKKRAFLNVLKAIKSPRGYGVNRLNAIKQLLFSAFDIISLLLLRDKNIFKMIGSSKKFYDGDYAFRRGETVAFKSEETPTVSVVVRTFNRAGSLRRALLSVCNQTYKNIEVIVAEDGEPTAKKMLEGEFSNLNIVYINDQKRVGRTKNANRAFEATKGEYVMMLDDDDFLFPEHIEMAVGFAKQKNSEFVVMGCMAAKLFEKTTDQHKIEVAELMSLIMPRIDILTMTRRCLISIESVLVSRKALFETGLMREELEAHEDWNLWLRIMTKHSPLLIRYSTCMCSVPLDQQQDQKRLKEYSQYDKALLQDETLNYIITKKQIKEFEQHTNNDLDYLETLGRLEQHLADEFSAVEDIETTLKIAENVVQRFRKNDCEMLSAKQLNALYFWFLKNREKNYKSQL